MWVCTLFAFCFYQELPKSASQNTFEEVNHSINKLDFWGKGCSSSSDWKGVLNHVKGFGMLNESDCV